MTPRYLYAELSSLVQARLNCLSRTFETCEQAHAYIVVEYGERKQDVVS